MKDARCLHRHKPLFQVIEFLVFAGQRRLQGGLQSASGVERVLGLLQAPQELVTISLLLRRLNLQQMRLVLLLG